MNENAATEVHIFKGPGRVFGATLDTTGRNLPAQFGPWNSFKTITLRRDVPTPGIDPNECLDDIERYGVHITDAHVRITERAVQDSADEDSRGASL